MAFKFSNLFGDQNKKALAKYEALIPVINDFEVEISALTDEELRNKTLAFKARLEAGETLDDISTEAFAVVREASKRTLKQRHYDVQMIGGLVMHDGNISEMRTGEGKTLVATLPVYLNALSGKGVHVVTVNDYLARRDAVWMGEIYAFLGLSVGVINSQDSFLYDKTFAKEGEEKDVERDEQGYFKVVHEFLKPCSRRESYAADITYGTNSEFGFDYLRDNISYKEEDLRQRDLNFAIIDEIDSILIDEARTPLIISSPTSESESLYGTFASIANILVEGEDYEVDEKAKALTLTDSGIEKAEKKLGIENIYTDGGIRYVHHLELAVKAKALYKKEKEYVVRDGKVMIVDEFTGRILNGRRYSEGLHQAIEAKEGVKLEKESRTFASITYQNYFRMYKKLAGMTGTAMTSQEEFYRVYGLITIAVPTNKPIARIDRDDLIFQTESGKFRALAKKVKELNEAGQPVLIGTVSIEKNELLSDFLDKEGVKHNILNAKNHENEASIIARAGEVGAVTIATNMAGRGVDIKLGGEDNDAIAKQKVIDAGGLFVIGTERHEARRIDNQLRGRSGRQGDPGETQFFVSLEDDLMRVFSGDSVKSMMGRFGIPEDQPIQNKLITRSLESAQEKIEGLNFDRRKHVLDFDDVMNHQRRTIYTKRRSILMGDRDELKEMAESILGDENLSLIEEKIKLLGEDKFYEVFRAVSLQSLDMLWVEHLEAMDYLKSSVSLRSVGQRDPLVEYRREGLVLFKDLEASIDDQIFKVISGIGEGSFAQESNRLQTIKKEAEVAEKTSFGDGKVQTVVNRDDKIGRNDKVEISNGKETRVMKYKKAEELVEEGVWKVTRVVKS
ncbi:preprotein translocase subunit SecA [Candidatus Campbellbacteria bacterium CG22_combo_CG10-13_8_21_14_all_36_13]|uniref:Protein translocase subunit SecA n=1 Tax=Candidatus Campbellbacteria bacterium CG22_combo_CG10-13_8_21_14_all_36_13 TaxID=1974529 RepID=A0A2H0DYZ3_9BACT|nr:MAG: preprotein translocase subunit SecA [Candidatus Campbellbacteria bacterium CG22_combo_CG10-13_8_21_14_all_36_13]